MVRTKESIRYFWFVLNKWLVELQEFLKLLLPDKSIITKVSFGISMLCIVSFLVFAIMAGYFFLVHFFGSEDTLIKSEVRVARICCEDEIAVAEKEGREIDDDALPLTLVQRIREYQRDTAIYFCLVDSNNLLLASTRADWVGDSLLCQKQEVTEKVNFATIKDEEGVTMPDGTYHKEYCKLKNSDWQLVMLLPHQRYFTLMDSFLELGKKLVACLGIMLVGFMLMFVFMRRSLQQQKTLEGEVDVAAKLQQKMVPQNFPAFPDRKDFDVHGVLIPAKLMGGDLYDFVLRDDKLLFCVGDVSGKGMSAALLMSVVHSVFRAASSHTFEASEIASMINEAIAHGNEDSMFCTLFTGVLEVKTGVLNFCNAGHNLPLIVEADGSTHFLEALPNIALGVIEEYPYQSQQASLEEGASILLYTDGVTEAVSIDRRLFGDNATLSTLSGKAALTPRESIELLLESIRRHSRFNDQSDDITMLCVKRM